MPLHQKKDLAGSGILPAKYSGRDKLFLVYL